MVGVTGGHSRKRVLFGSADRRPWSSGRDRSLEVAMVLAATIGLIGSVAGSIPLTNAQTDSTPQPPTVASLMDAARAAGRSSDWAAALPPLLQAERMLGQQATAANPATLVTLHQAIATAAWHQKRYELVVEHCQRLLTLLPAGSQATPVDAERIAAVRQMLVRSLARSGQLNRAVVELQPLANGPASAQAFVVDQAMAMAAGALTTGQPNVAISAYSLVLRQQPPESQAVEASVGVARIFQIALESGDDALWNAALKTLLTVDRDGRLTHMILQYWAQADAAGSASQAAQVSPAALSEHLVIDLLGKLIELETTVDGPEAATATAAADGGQAGGEEAPAACVAACRWCGAQGRWPLLALLVDDLSVPDRQRPASLRRGVTIDRLIAESLMQTRRGSEALAWWTSLCQVWQCDDFPTRLRAAEVAVAFGTPEDAQQRLQAAAAVADDDPFQQTLLQMLAAELQMRHRRWDQAQTALMSIADQAATAGPLRARAQWLIGECYLMQEKYTEAIDAYRRVERLDREGQWSAAAMLQAGQAHEKLGQAQQAAACYTDLLTRFANLPHADHARTRLAQLDAASSLHR